MVVANSTSVRLSVYSFKMYCTVDSVLMDKKLNGKLGSFPPSDSRGYLVLWYEYKYLVPHVSRLMPHATSFLMVTGIYND